RRPREKDGARDSQRPAGRKGFLSCGDARKPWRILGGRSLRERVMTAWNWPLVEVAARLLERDEREAVLGDLLEARESAWDALTGVLGLAFRRQAQLWKSWRPWLAGFGVTLPSSFLLMGTSLSV